MSVCDEILESRSALKTRKVNVIHRTTSETIRLGDPDLFINNSITKPCSILPSRKKPVSSFQVTGISVTQRQEFGDDSADDLDESHTDDISRITDNETPSFSEESFSRDIEEVPIISPVTTNILPIGPCYELAIVAAEKFEITTVEVDDQELSVLCSDITDNSSEFDLASVLSKMTTTTTYAGQCVRIVGGRFKVVKIETAEPFRRGRWSCLDYLDQSIAINPHIIKTQHMNLIITDPIAYYSNANNNSATVTTGKHSTEAKFNSNLKTDQNNTYCSSAIATTISSVPTNILTETQQNRTHGYIEGQLPVQGQTLPAIFYCNTSGHNTIQPHIITTASILVSTPQSYRVATKVAESRITYCTQHKEQTGFNQSHGELLQDSTNFSHQAKGEQKDIFESPPVTLSNYNLFNVPTSYITSAHQGQTYKEQSVGKGEAESISFGIPPDQDVGNSMFSRPQQHLRSAYSLPTGIPPAAYTHDPGVGFFALVSPNTNMIGQPNVAADSSSSFTFQNSGTHAAFTFANDALNSTQATSQPYILQTSIHSSPTLPCIHQFYQIQDPNLPQQSSQVYSQSVPPTNMPFTSLTDFQKGYQYQSTAQNTLTQINNPNVYMVSSVPVSQNIPTHQRYHISSVQNQIYAAQNYTAKSEHHLSNDQNQFSRNYETPSCSLSDTCQPYTETKGLYEKTILTEQAEVVYQCRPRELSLQGNFQIPATQNESPIHSLPQEYPTNIYAPSFQEFRNIFHNSPTYGPTDVLGGSPIQSPMAPTNHVKEEHVSVEIVRDDSQQGDPVTFRNEPTLPNQSSQISGGISLLGVIDEEDMSLKDKASLRETHLQSISVSEEHFKTLKSEGSQTSDQLGETRSAATSTPDDDFSRISRISSGNGLSCANNANAAIDNKIEKAMDLVKSHLMYTVREEVDVLKEKIVELMDRINQLEIENNYLKANVSPEVLTALNNGAAQAMAEKEADKSTEEENDEQKREQ